MLIELLESIVEGRGLSGNCVKVFELLREEGPKKNRKLLNKIRDGCTLVYRQGIAVLGVIANKLQRSSWH